MLFRNNKKLLKYSFLLLILIFGFIIRVIDIDKRGIWFDEKASVSCAVGIPFSGIHHLGATTWQDLGCKGNQIFISNIFWKYNTLQNVIGSAIQDNSSIAYFTALHYWINLFGTSDNAVRLLSVIFSCLIIVVIYFFSYEIFSSSRLALLSSYIAAIHPLLISEGRFTSSHIMAALFTLLSTYLFFKIFKQKKRNLLLIIAYSLITIISILSHYFAVYVFLGHWVIMLSDCHKITVSS